MDNLIGSPTQTGHNKRKYRTSQIHSNMARAEISWNSKNSYANIRME